MPEVILFTNLVPELAQQIIGTGSLGLECVGPRP